MKKVIAMKAEKEKNVWKDIRIKIKNYVKKKRIRREVEGKMKDKWRKSVINAAIKHHFKHQARREKLADQRKREKNTRNKRLFWSGKVMTDS